MEYTSEERLKKGTSKENAARLNLILKWVNNQRDNLKELSTGGSSEENHLKVSETGSVINHPGYLEVASLIENLQDNYASGKISLYEKRHMDRLMELFYLLQVLQVPSHESQEKVDVFKGFTITHIATIFRLHFEKYNGFQLNTVQKDFTEISKKVKNEAPAIRKMNQALQEFFSS